MDIARSPGESDISYHKRLIYGKLVDKTLADLDYSELSELVYGQSYNSDVARRMLYGSCKTLQLLDREAEGAAPKDLLAEINEKKLELQKEQQRFRDQRREFNKLVSSAARSEHLESALIDAANNLSSTVGSLYAKERGWSPFGFSEENEAVLVFSDWHYGLTASNAFNEYNTAICMTRVKSIVEQAIARIRLHGCSRLHVVVLGDLIHGAIHTSARVASEELVCDQIIQVSEVLAQSIEELNKYVDETMVYVTYGNHARTVPNKKDNLHRDNMERLVPWWLEQRFKGCEDIAVYSDGGDEFLFIDACGHEICATHGDLDSVKSAPRLFAALFQKKEKRNIEYILLGDKHHIESFEELGVYAMMCGSLCGTDDYANGKRLFSTPSQLMLIVNPDCGVDAEYRLNAI